MSSLPTYPAASSHTRLAQVLRALSPLEDGELSPLLALFQPLTLRRGQYLLRTGQPVESVAFIHQGLFQLGYEDQRGRLLVKSFCAEGDLVSDLASFLTGQPARLSIEALEDSELLVAPLGPFRAVLDSSLAGARLAQRFVERLYVAKAEREAAFLLQSAEERYATFLARAPGLAERLRDYQVAAYLGITPVALSRIRRRRVTRRAS